MRTLLRTAIVGLVGLGAGVPAFAQVELRADQTFNSIAAVMFAKSRCGFSIDRERLEAAMNYNGLYSGDMRPGGRYYARIRYFYEQLEERYKEGATQICDNIKQIQNGHRNVWQGVILDNPN